MRKQRTADGRAENRCNRADRHKKSPGRGRKGGNKPDLLQDHANQIFTYLSDAVIVHRDGKILFANLAAANLHGAETPGQLVGKELLDLVHPEDREFILSRRAQTMKGVTAEPAMRKGLRIDGTEITVETSGSLLDWDGEAAILTILRDVTERKKFEEALQTREKLYRDLIEGSTFGIQVSRPGAQRLFVNRNFVEMHGYDTAEELLAITRPGAMVARHDRERLIEIRRIRAAGGDALDNYEYDALRKDGSIIPVEVFIRYVSWEGAPAIQRTFIDITARRKAEEAQRESEARYRSLVEYVPEAVVVTDQGTILFCNPAAIELYGADDEAQLVGMYHLDLIHPDDHKRVLPRILKSAAAGPVTKAQELCSLRIGGEEISTESFSAPFLWNGTVVRLVIIRDITERKKAEAEREQMVETLLQAHRRIEDQAKSLEEMAERSNRAMQEAQMANEAKTVFLAMMSHELRTPLNAILGFSDIMANRVFGPLGNSKYEDYARDINDSGQHLLDLINDILDLSKVESGYEELQEEAIDVNTLLPQLMTLVKSRADRSGVAIEEDCSGKIPSLYADRRKLKQILVNLLSNAIKFTPPGGKVRLKVWCRPDSGYVFQVIDSGIGIALENIPKALTPFHQVDNDVNRATAGTGLGLPLSKALVELHGGSLDVQSRVNGGTTVTVRFPAMRVSAPASLGKKIRGKG